LRDDEFSLEVFPMVFRGSNAGTAVPFDAFYAFSYFQ